mmetsp:Transcript_26412/g.87570  ORF Transcript_26412/g.87570 Transcript_26412/m.87570 type:complete len:205 (+) Transcript_26412:1305-1919(+)
MLPAVHIVNILITGLGATVAPPRASSRRGPRRASRRSASPASAAQVLDLRREGLRGAAQGRQWPGGRSRDGRRRAGTFAGLGLQQRGSGDGGGPVHREVAIRLMHIDLRGLAVPVVHKDVVQRVGLHEVVHALRLPRRHKLEGRGYRGEAPGPRLVLGPNRLHLAVIKGPLAQHRRFVGGRGVDTQERQILRQVHILHNAKCLL